ncbi:hypothetical protein B4Q13_17105, partial [Lacticaseibacillus rhamnosus]
SEITHRRKSLAKNLWPSRLFSDRLPPHPTMKTPLHPVVLLLPLLASCATQSPKVESPALPGVAAVVQKSIDQHDIPGAVTMVVTKDKVLDFEVIGMSDIEKQQ